MHLIWKKNVTNDNNCTCYVCSRPDLLTWFLHWYIYECDIYSSCTAGIPHKWLWKGAGGGLSNPSSMCIIYYQSEEIVKKYNIPTINHGFLSVVDPEFSWRGAPTLGGGGGGTSIPFSKFRQNLPLFRHRFSGKISIFYLSWFGKTMTVHTLEL